MFLNYFLQGIFYSINCLFYQYFNGKLYHLLQAEAVVEAHPSTLVFFPKRCIKSFTEQMHMA